MTSPKEIVMTQKEYAAVHKDYKSTWTTERTDWKDWDEVRDRYMGKRTLMRHSCLYIEGMGLTITD